MPDAQRSHMRFMLIALSLALSFAVTACATPAPTPPAPDARVIEDAERAFAADAAERGWVASFRRHAAADAIVLWSGDPGDPQQELAALSAERPDTSLRWHPLWVGIARSGDFGFSTGPVINGDRNSQYFSIWRREADGSWRWIYDGGFASDGPSPAAYDAPALHAGTAQDGVGAAATAQVRAAEEALAEASVTDYRGALEATLAADGRLLGSRAQPAAGEAARAGELASRPAKISLGTLGAAQSQAGDLVYTYGSMLWVEDGEHIRRGHYVRVWRLDAAGWGIVADLFLPKREPPAG